METTTQSHDAKKRPALGKGIESLLGPRVTHTTPPAEAAPTGKPLEIPLDRIERNPHQTRTAFSEAALAELAASVQAVGVMQPVTVRELGGGRYQLIMGERRWRASQLAGKTTIPAVIKQVNDEQVLEMTIVENLQREDLNPMEQARAFDQLVKVFKLTQEQVAVRTGKDRASISNYMRLLKLPPALQTSVETGKLSLSHAKTLMMLEDQDRMLAAGLKVIGLDLSVRQTQEYVDGLLQASMGLDAKPKPPAAKPQDPNVKAAEEKLRQRLGLRVAIQDRNGKGKVVIEYSGVDEFDHILDALGG